MGAGTIVAMALPLTPRTVPAMLYFGYMSIVSISFFLLTASIGFFSCFWFVTKIYSSIKVD